MGKCLPGPGTAGSSAAATGRRAEGAHRHRRLVNTVCLLGAAALLVAGLVLARPPLLVVAAAAGAIGWWARPEPDADRWRRGADGELATATMLAHLPRRFVVLHDRHQPGHPGNIDHVVIGPSGIWVVDSKVRRAVLRIRRGQVWAGEHVVDPEPAARQAELIAAALGRPVGAIVAVHGAGLRRRGKRVGVVRIVPADRVCRRLRHGRELSRHDVLALAAAADRTFPAR